MKPQYTPDQLLDMTRPLRRKGWAFIYIKEQALFKISKRHLQIVMDIEMFQEIFIERADRSTARRGVPKDRHGLSVKDISVGMMLFIDDEYYLVLSIGCAMAGGGRTQPARDYAILAQVTASDLTLCNLQLNPAPDGVDAIMCLRKLDLHKTHLN
jgi:hypothetical protein